MPSPCCVNGICPQHRSMRKAAKRAKWKFESQRRSNRTAGPAVTPAETKTRPVPRKQKSALGSGGNAPDRDEPLPID
jgi:hypothetical protein